MNSRLLFCLFFVVFILQNDCVTGQYGVNLGFQLPGLGNYPRYGNYRDNGYGNSRQYANSYDGYSPYNGPSSYGGSYPPPSYLNSGSNSQNLGSALGDISVAVLKSLSDYLMGPEPDPFPFGLMGPFQGNSRNRYQSQYGYGVNAGVYAGAFGGQSASGPRGSYGPGNGNAGRSYGGLSGWPLVPIPWFPLSTTTNPPTTTATTPTTTTTAPAEVTPIPETQPADVTDTDTPVVEGDGIASVVEVPVDIE